MSDNNLKYVIVVHDAEYLILDILGVYSTEEKAMEIARRFEEKWSGYAQTIIFTYAEDFDLPEKEIDGWHDIYSKEYQYPGLNDVFITWVPAAGHSLRFLGAFTNHNAATACKREYEHEHKGEFCGITQLPLSIAYLAKEKSATFSIG